MLALKNGFVKYALIIGLLLSLTSCFNVSKKLKQFPSPFQFAVSDSVGGFDTVLYAKAYTWMVRNLTNPKPVIEDDKRNGIIIGKCIMEVPIGKDAFGNIAYNEHVHYVFSVAIQNGKYKCMLSGFWHEGIPTARGKNDMGSLDSHKPHKINSKISRKHYYEVKRFAEEQANAMLKDFRTMMGT